MELKQLEHFVTVAREGGFARAARALSLSQPSVTRSVAALEKALDVQLFERSTLGATLNDAGSRLLPHAVAMLQEAERARAEFGSTGQTPALSEVRVGISPNILFNPLARVLRDAIETSSETKIVVNTGTYESLSKGLRQRELDFVICVSPGWPTERTPDDLVLESLGAEQVVPVARAGHAVFDTPATLESLAGHRWAVPLQMSLTYRFEYVFYQRQLPIPTRGINSSSLTLMFDAVDDWGMLGMLPRSMLAYRQAEDRIRVIDVPELALDYDIALLSNVRGEMPEQARRLFDAFRRSAGKAGPR